MAVSNNESRPAPPPRRYRRCEHGPMKMSWVEDSDFRAGGYWDLYCERCEYGNDAEDDDEGAFLDG